MASKNDPCNWYISCNDTAGNVGNSSSGYVYHDLTDPGINPSSIQNTSITYDSAIISWSVDETTKNKVYYGTNNTDLTNWKGAEGSSFTTTPSITLPGLAASTTYYFYLESCDQFNHCVNETNNGNDYNFTTTTIPLDNSNGGNNGGGGGGGGGS